MTTESRHLSVHVDRPAAEVYDFAADPTNLPLWAQGLGGPLVHEEGAWFVETAAGRARLTFAPRNEYGVLDHEVVTPAGETVHVPLRVIPDGDASEVVFTLRRAPGMTDAELERDAAAVMSDLGALRTVVERLGGAGSAG